MPDEKDRFGDKLRDVERGREDDYFKRRDRELIEKARRQRLAAARCPQCGEALVSRERAGTTVVECPRCTPA
jgi:ribosomal protein L37AE/L43A